MSYRNSTPIHEGSTIAALEETSFSDEAARIVQTSAPDSTIVYSNGIAGVWEQMRKNNAYALIPFENSSDGVVWPHLDQLCREEMINIVGEVHLKVRMCAGGLLQAGESIEEALVRAQVACSHPKALGQTNVFRDAHAIPGVKEMSSTVAGARYVQEEGDVRNIAIASKLALQKYHLDILAEDIANLKGDANVTRFFAVHRNGEKRLPNPEAKYHAVLITPENKRGILSRITSIIDNARVDLSSLQSRSIGNKQYNFFLEMTREGDPAEFRIMAEQLAYHVKLVKWLGSWDHLWEN
jgi:prephenate dehydratase